MKLSSGARSGLTGFVAQTQRQWLSPKQVHAYRLAKHPAYRFGEPSELGNACAYLCSAHADYINGQNLLLNGGPFSGVF